MALPDPEAPAKLFRSRSVWAEEVHLHPFEEIGNGSLAKMVRIVISDPDDAYWAYSITTADRAYESTAILKLRKLLEPQS